MCSFSLCLCFTAGLRVTYGVLVGYLVPVGPTFVTPDLSDPESFHVAEQNQTHSTAPSSITKFPASVHFFAASPRVPGLLPCGSCRCVTPEGAPLCTARRFLSGAPSGLQQTSSSSQTWIQIHTCIGTQLATDKRTHALCLTYRASLITATVNTGNSFSSVCTCARGCACASLKGRFRRQYTSPAVTDCRQYVGSVTKPTLDLCCLCSTY